MAKRRKRRSQAVLTERAMKDIRNLHRDHLREISAILTNVLGFPVKVSPVRAQEVLTPPKRKKAKVTRRIAHVAGYQEEPKPEHLEPDDVTDLARDEVGI